MRYKWNFSVKNFLQMNVIIQYEYLYFKKVKYFNSTIHCSSKQRNNLCRNDYNLKLYGKHIRNIHDSLIYTFCDIHIRAHIN